MAARLPNLSDMAPDLVDVFDVVVSAAVAGRRCPPNHKNVARGGAPTISIDSRKLQRLARDGFLQIDIYPKNWRMVTIRVGPHAGATTARPPDRTKPYKTIRRGDPVEPTREMIAP